MSTRRELMNKLLTDAPTVACRIVEVTETLANVTVQFERVTWVVPQNVDDENTEYDDAEAGAPGALFVSTGLLFAMQFEREDAMTFDVGRHYVLNLTEVLDVTRDDEL